MRKWYGAAPRSEARDDDEDEDEGPRGQRALEEEEEDEGDGSAVLVTDADTPMGEQVVLQLILARCVALAVTRCVSAGPAEALGRRQVYTQEGMHALMRSS